MVAAFVLAVAGVGLWSFLRRISRGAHARLRRDGLQEADIVVRERYRPSKVVARPEIPLVLNFLRDEDDPCSRRVIFPDFGISRLLPDGRITSVLIGPRHKGEYLFTCELGMYQGSILVRGSAWSPGRFLHQRRSDSSEAFPLHPTRT